MNLETYQQCISSLEKQIQSREQERHQMAMTIQQLDCHLSSQISINQQMKQQLSTLSRANRELQQQLHEKILIIEQHQGAMNQSLTKDEFMQQKITMLEKQKKYLQQELLNRDAVIGQKTTRINELQADNSKNLSLIDDYRKMVNEKTKQSQQLQSKTNSMSQQIDKLTTQLNRVKSQHEQQKKVFEQKATGSVEELRFKIFSLVQQMDELRQIHSNQLNTIQFTHAQEMDEIKKEQTFLRNEITHYLQVIDQLKQQLQQSKLQLQTSKQQYETFNSNKDQIVNQLINEINFLKDQKVQLEKKSSLELQSVTEEIIKIGLERMVFLEKEKKLQSQISIKEEQANQLQGKFKQLTALHNKLSFEKDLCLQELSNEKGKMFTKDEQINQMKQQIQKQNKTIQTLRKEKESSSTSSSVELILLRQQNIDLERTILKTQEELQEQKIGCIEMEQTIKQLNYDKANCETRCEQLMKLVPNHQGTIMKLQSLLEQSGKVITQLNLTMKLKLQQIQALQNSNHIFRKQKLQWLQKQQYYRKRVIQSKQSKSSQHLLNKAYTDYYRASSSSKSTNSRIRMLTEIQNSKSRTLVKMVNNSPSHQNLQHLYSASSVVNHNSGSYGVSRSRVKTPINWLQQLSFARYEPYFKNPNNNNVDYYNPNKNPYQSSSSNEQVPLEKQDFQPNTQQTYKQRGNSFRLKSSQSQQTNLPIQTNQHIMKKKNKHLQFVVENGISSNHNHYQMKKDYSVGKISTLKFRD